MKVSLQSNMQYISLPIIFSCFVLGANKSASSKEASMLELSYVADLRNRLDFQEILLSSSCIYLVKSLLSCS